MPKFYNSSVMDNVLCIAENEVDGEAFLLLTDEQIRTLVKPLGSQMKLISKKNSIVSNSDSFKYCRYVY